MQSFGFEGTEVRTLWQDDAPWFVAQDVCACLEIGNHRQAVSRLDDDERGAVTTDDATGRMQEQLIISESGMYALIFKSRKPAAVRFRKWVTGEVLPTLRRTGRFVMAPANDESREIDGLLDAPDDIERFKVKLALVREARYVYGRRTARNIWERVGLPEVRTELPVASHYTPDELAPCVREWMAERTELTPHVRTESSALYDDYQAWCADRERPGQCRRAFGDMLTRFGIRPIKSNRIQRVGIRLKD